MKDKITIQIDSRIPKAIFIGFLLSVITIFIIEHFGEFDYEGADFGYVTLPFDENTIMNRPVTHINLYTPFKTTVNIDPSSWQVKDLVYSKNSNFYQYSNKVKYYSKAVIHDYKYVLYFTIMYSLIILAFSYIRIKLK